MERVIGVKMNANVRINKFDNLKGLAIFLVVLGHFIYFTKTSEITFVHNVVHIIHLPIFFFVAGYFSKIGPDEPTKAFKRLMVPFIIFCILYWLFAKFVLLMNPKTLFIYPGFGLWFLISLFFMKMILPIVDKLKYPVLISMVAAILSGFVDCSVLGLSRTFCFLPVFLIGFYYKEYAPLLSGYSFLNRKSTAILIIILTAISILCAAKIFPFRVIYFKHHYYSPILFDMIGRIIVILLGMIVALILNQIMTNRNIILTKFGKNSMSVYILHLFTVILFQEIMKAFYPNHELMSMAIVILMTFIVVFITSRDIVAQTLNGFTDAVFDLFFKS